MAVNYGILLAAGSGSRLWPLTSYVNKHLCTVYDKPLIYYPLTILILAGCKDIAIVINESDIEVYGKLVGYLNDLNLNADLVVQARDAVGIPSAISCVSENVDHDQYSRFIVALGDNILVSDGLVRQLNNVPSQKDAFAFSQKVSDPERFGIVTRDVSGKVVELEEKPLHPRSNEALVGLYSFPGNMFSLCSGLSPSKRGETEITDLLKQYLNQNSLQVRELSRGSVWLDAGTTDALSYASSYVEMTQKMHNYLIGSIEEAAVSAGLISEKQVVPLLSSSGDSSYHRLLRRSFQ